MKWYVHVIGKIWKLLIDPWRVLDNLLLDTIIVIPFICQFHLKRIGTVIDIRELNLPLPKTILEYESKDMHTLTLKPVRVKPWIISLWFTSSD